MVAMDEGATKDAVAQQLFGDAGNRLNAILKDGALEDYIALAETYGTVIDEDAIAATDDWNAALADLGGVIKGTGTELADFLDLSATIRGTTAGFIFLREIGVGVVEELVGNVRLLSGAFDKLKEGDIAGAVSDFADATILSVGETKKLINDAANATLEFIEQSEAIDNTSGAIDRNVTQLGRLSAADDEAAKSAKNLAAERAKFAKEQEREFQAIISAQQELSDISRSATEDQATGIELINLALTDQLMVIDEIEETLGRNSGTELARTQVRERAARDIQQLQLEQVEELDIKMQEAFENEVERRADIKSGIQENINIALEGFANLSAAADAFLKIQADGVADAARQQRRAVDDRVGQTDEAQERLFEAETEIQRARALADVKELAAEEEKSERILAIQQVQSDKLFKARQTLEVANIVISGASAAIAALGPPPVGAGPVLGGFLAATIGAATAGQIALVKAQTAPQFDAGFPGFTLGPDNFPATLRTGEAVLNQAATDAIGGSEAVNQLNETQSLGGGRSQEVILQVGQRELGRATVEEMGAGRELDRAIQQRTGRRAGVRPVYNNR